MEPVALQFYDFHIVLTALTVQILDTRSDTMYLIADLASGTRRVVIKSSRLHVLLLCGCQVALDHKSNPGFTFCENPRCSTERSKNEDGVDTIFVPQRMMYFTDPSFRAVVARIDAELVDWDAHLEEQAALTDNLLDDSVAARETVSLVADGKEQHKGGERNEEI